MFDFQSISLTSKMFATISVLCGLYLVQGVGAASLTTQYGVVIDAGSSGSRVHVYKWSTRGDRGELPTDLKEIYNFKVKPGLSSFEDNIEGIDAYIKELLSNAVDNVPLDSRSSTSIFLLATAGMRIVPEEKATAMMNIVDGMFSDPEISPFEFSPSNARILSGEEEAVFAWIDINHNLGYFVGAISSSVGLLEMGGASAQIAFLPEGDPLANMFPVTLNGVDYKLYAHSYLAYGQEYSQQWKIQYLWEQQGHPNSLTDPCLLEGDIHDLTLDVEGSPVVELIGSSDSQGCADLTNMFVYEVNPIYCHPEPCAIGSVYQPDVPQDMTVFAVSAFVFVFEDLDAMFGGVIDADGFVVPQAVLDAANKVCDLNLEDAVARSIQDPEFAAELCHAGMYFGTLLIKGYNFDTQSSKIKLVHDVNGNEIAWTQGALLYELLH